MKIALYFIIFIMGTFFGSFSSYAINHIPKKKSLLERSTCEFCKHKLGLLDSIPILSYVFSGGKCRYCGKKRYSGYFWSELLVGIVSICIYYSIARNVGNNVHFNTYRVFVFNDIYFNTYYSCWY